MSQNIPACAPSQIERNASNDVVCALAEQYGMTPDSMYYTLKNTVFREARNDDEFFALCLVAKQYKLNPLLRQIYAFPSKGGGITPLVGVDGYINVMNRQPDFDGITFDFAEETVSVGNPPKKFPAWCEARIMRKSCSTPVVVREYMDECWRGTEPWRSHPRRMLRHKALAQCVRLAFGMSGVYADPDDAEPVTVHASVHDEAGRQPLDVNVAIEQAAMVKPEEQTAPRQASKTERPAASRPAKDSQPMAMPASVSVDSAWEDFFSDGGGESESAARDACWAMVQDGRAKDMTAAKGAWLAARASGARP